MKLKTTREFDKLLYNFGKACLADGQIKEMSDLFTEICGIYQQTLEAVPNDDPRHPLSASDEAASGHAGTRPS